MSDRDAVPGLAEKLKAAREAVELSQMQAAERSGVHQVSIARFETGVRVPTIASLYKLAEAYGLNVCDLLPGGVLPTDTASTKPKRGRRKDAGGKKGG